jgi:hypothetical protein
MPLLFYAVSVKERHGKILTVEPCSGSGENFASALFPAALA